MNEKKEIRISFGTAVVLIIAIALIGLMAGVIFYLKMENTNIAKNNEVKQIDKNTNCFSSLHLQVSSLLTIRK